MTLHLWFIFAITYLGITLSPGPNVLVVLSHASKYGLPSIIITISANLFCQLLIIIAVGMGIATLLTTGSALYTIVKYIGAAYLIYLGLKGFKGVLTNKINEKSSVPLMEGHSNIPSKTRRFVEAFSVSISNPKTVIFLSAFLPQFISPNHSVSLQFSIMFITIGCIVASIHSLYAFMLVRVQNRMSPCVENTVLPSLSSAIYLCLGIGMGASR